MFYHLEGSTAPIHGMKSTNVEYIIQAKFKSDKLHHIDDLQQQKLITVVNRYCIVLVIRQIVSC